MIDVDHQINAVRRQVGRTMLEAGEARVVTISQAYDTDRDDLWDARTNPTRIPRWFLPVSGELRLGGRYQLEGNAGGEVTACDPPSAFSATWEYGGEVSWIEVRFVAESPRRTRLVLEHVAHVDDERWAEFGPGAVGVGWDLAVMGLALHVTTGGDVDPAEAAVWLASADGRRLVTRSSRAWEAASIAAGEDEAAARSAAQRTTDAYTAAP